MSKGGIGIEARVVDGHTVINGLLGSSYFGVELIVSTLELRFLVGFIP